VSRVDNTQSDDGSRSGVTGQDIKNTPGCSLGVVSDKLAFRRVRQANVLNDLDVLDAMNQACDTPPGIQQTARRLVVPVEQLIPHAALESATLRNMPAAVLERGPRLLEFGGCQVEELGGIVPVGQENESACLVNESGV
jgi:hypothetical protein